MGKEGGRLIPLEEKYIWLKRLLKIEAPVIFLSSLSVSQVARCLDIRNNIFCSTVNENGKHFTSNDIY